MILSEILQRTASCTTIRTNLLFHSTCVFAGCVEAQKSIRMYTLYISNLVVKLRALSITFSLVRHIGGRNIASNYATVPPNFRVFILNVLLGSFRGNNFFIPEHE